MDALISLAVTVVSTCALCRLADFILRRMHSQVRQEALRESAEWDWTITHFGTEPK